MSFQHGQEVHDTVHDYKRSANLISAFRVGVVLLNLAAAAVADGGGVSAP
jgi:hypothetical protein